MIEPYPFNAKQAKQGNKHNMLTQKHGWHLQEAFSYSTKSKSDSRDMLNAELKQ